MNGGHRDPIASGMDRYGEAGREWVEIDWAAKRRLTVAIEFYVI